jgi:hypothetical protein
MVDLPLWRRYRHTMYHIASELETGDLASIELALRYIELHYIGSYAGYTRALLARRLKHAPLSREQRARLTRHFYALLETEERSAVFSIYIGLWRRIIAPGEILAVKSLVNERGPQDKKLGEKLLQRLDHCTPVRSLESPLGRRTILIQDRRPIPPYRPSPLRVDSGSRRAELDAPADEER